MNKSKKTNETYKLVGFMNLFDIVPDFVYPVFQSSEDHLFYFQDANEETLTLDGFCLISDSHCSRITFFNDSIKTNKFSSTESSIGSKPIFAFQVSKNFVQIGFYKDLKKFFKSFETTNSILRAEIDFFFNVTGCKA